MRSPRVEKEISAYTLACANSHHGYVTFSRFGVLGSQTHQSVRESAWRAIFHFRGGGSKRSACNASRVRRVDTPRPRGDDIAGVWSTVDASTPDPATRAVRCAGRASDADPPRSHD